MTASSTSLDFPPLSQWLKWLAQKAPSSRWNGLFQMGGWPWFGSAAIDENLMPWGRSGLGKRPAKGPTPMLPPDRPTPDAALRFHHIPVLLEEVMAALQPQPGQLILDGTLGGGGHSEAMLALGARVVGMDQDHEALHAASARLAKFGDQFVALYGNFRRFPEILAETGVTQVDGILVDLGVSSHQLDEARRGFSFQKDGPLDLRMDPSTGQPASHLVNTASADELAQIFRDYGEEPRAWHIAQAIVKARLNQPILRTLDLADLITKAFPGRGKRHPATQVFQALRIAVNDELGALDAFLRTAPRFLKPGGRLAVITFHSLEDRLCKKAFHQMAAATLDRPEWPEPRPNPDHLLKLLSRKSIEPSPAEIQRNPRARSARLRAAERITSTHSHGQ
jgi:16S rRNA (cytosine1402-N4)-methyltransferase